MAENIIVDNFGSIDRSSLALISELKNELYQIARRAELGPHALAVIQSQSEMCLKLIDSYILSAQTDHGQQKLDLEPVALGSILHEAASEARKSPVVREVVIEANALKPVMTNRYALHGLLAAAAQAMNDVLAKNGRDILVMRSYVAKGGAVGVGVFAENDDLSAVDLRAALHLTGKSHMPLARHSAGSGIMLTIADGLARALGGTLEVKRMGRFRGFATTLPQSTQLALV